MLIQNKRIGDAPKRERRRICDLVRIKIKLFIVFKSVECWYKDLIKRVDIEK
jgi:hypothetical protein